MAKFRSKPREITAILCTEDEILDLPFLVVNRLTPGGEFEVYNELHNTWVKVRYGVDYLVVDDPQDVYPLAPEKLENNYEPL